jgi:hypothetical protein
METRQAFGLFGLEKQAKELGVFFVFSVSSSSQELYPWLKSKPTLVYTLRICALQKVLIHFFMLMLCTFAVEIPLPNAVLNHAFFSPPLRSKRGLTHKSKALVSRS